MDFPLVLVVLTFACGLGWLLDVLVFQKPRKQKISEMRTKLGIKATDTPSSEQQEVLDKLAREPYLIELGKSFFPVFFVVLVVRSFVAEPFQIPSGSMLPTLKVNDFILVNKFEYGLRLPVAGTKVVPYKDPARGDVMVFKFPNNPKINFIKRVVGLPGDRITYKDKQLFINDKLVEETLIQPPSLQNRMGSYTEQLGEVSHQIYKASSMARVNKTWTVPEGHYFVMGDNRDNSNDSRFWGFVPDELVVGKAFAVWMHWEGIFNLPSFSESRWIE
ncbi:signal peptidase I [Litoribacillus peritrichatus]|uniref:signal peptidase I n=1 Tax=Litoribacillus peritrichatus TaxID=718191 RepID=UPI0031D1ECEC